MRPLPRNFDLSKEIVVIGGVFFYEGQPVGRVAKEIFITRKEGTYRAVFELKIETVDDFLDNLDDITDISIQSELDERDAIRDLWKRRGYSR